MTEEQRIQRLSRLAVSGGVCEVCGASLTTSNWQGAHRIANTKANRTKWGSFVIDHPLNIAIVCSLACNHICNIGYNPGECLKLVKSIIDFELVKFTCK